MTVRGAGHDEGGADLTNDIMISTEKLNKLLEIDPRERLVRVQSGITLKELNTALSVSGLRIPIEGRDNETIGGLISNCASGSYSGKYGDIMNYVERIEVVLANGECLQTERLKKYAIAKKAHEKTLEGEIYRKISKVLKSNEALLGDIEKNNKSLAGYPAVTKLLKRETLDLMPIFFGAQGTLGVISEVILKAIPRKKRPARVVATFREIGTATKYIDSIAKLSPCKLNLYDMKIIMEARESGKNLDGVIKRLEDGFAVIASFDDKVNATFKKISALKEKLPRSVKVVFESPENRPILNEFENSLVSYLGYVKNGERVPILTDFYLPKYNIGNFLSDLKVLEEKLSLDIALFGSCDRSIYSLRPKFNLEEEDFNKKATTFLKAGAYIINRQEGKLAGGTPEGRLKAIVTNTEMSDSEMKLYANIKSIFDKNDILNPEVKLGASSKFTLTHFRNVNLPKIVI